jgi:ribonuclease HI
MKLRLFASGVSLDKDQPSQRAGCAAVLLAKEGVRCKYREITHGLAALSGPQAELQAAYLALAAVRPRYRGGSVTLAADHYPVQMLERRGGAYAVNPRSNVQLAQQLRLLADQFADLTVIYSRSEEFVRAGELARVSARSQSQSDTGSLDRD